MTRLIVGVEGGHGGADHGAVSADGLLVESRLNLALASLVCQRLAARGLVDPVLVRVDDVNLSNTEAAGIARRAGCNAVVSIHHNTSLNAARHGGEVYHHRLDPTGAHLGKLCLAHVPQPYDWRTWAHDFRVGGVLGSKGAHDILEAYRAAGIPAALLEMAFLTNAADCRRVSAPTYIGEAAAAIADGVEDWADLVESKPATLNKEST